MTMYDEEKIQQIDANTQTIGIIERNQKCFDRQLKLIHELIKKNENFFSHNVATMQSLAWSQKVLESKIEELGKRKI